MPIIDNCLGCPYRHGAAVGPRGNPASRIVLVGEAPGAKEIIEGEPFRGSARDVLWRATLRPAQPAKTTAKAARTTAR